jgi:hypothetical protein
MSFLVNPYSYATGCDADAVAFLAAAGITDATITSAICTLVTTMKADGTWAKMSAIYPFVGNTASQQKWNLKDPRDLNAAFRLSFIGGWTHSANGALPNGTNAYADTFCLLTQLNSASISFYSRTDVDGLYNDIGNGNFSNASIILTKFGNTFYGGINQGNNPTAANLNSTGFYLVSRTANNIVKAYKNSSLLFTNTNLTSTIATNTFLISAWSGPTRYSRRQAAFASIGSSGLTDTEAAALYTSVQAFQTTLSRQV